MGAGSQPVLTRELAEAAALDRCQSGTGQGKAMRFVYAIPQRQAVLHITFSDARVAPGASGRV